MKNHVIEYHKQVCIKVNAYVDEKIARVVERLNDKFPDIVTKYSCQDNTLPWEKEHGYTPRAYITFCYRNKLNDWYLLAILCNTISSILNHIRYATVTLEWTEGRIIGKLEFLTENANEILAALS